MVLVAQVDTPTGLTAMSSSSTEINLSWTAPSSGSITGYNVYRGTTAGGESTTPLNASPLSASTTSYQDTTVQPGNTYFYTVQAVSGPAFNGRSNEASATTTNTASTTTTEVDLSSQYNQQGITTNGTKVSGGIDGAGNTLSESWVGTSQTVSGVNFNLGAANANNVVVAVGQTVGLPNGEFSQLQFLALGVNGNQQSQTFTVNYTDGTSKTFTQSLSDWHTPQSYWASRSRWP